MKASQALVLLIVVTSMCVSCGSDSQPPRQELHQLALNSASEIIASHLGDFDFTTSHDGQGSFRVDAADSMVVQIATVTGLDIDNAILVYRAYLKSEDLEGRAYLEMWCQFDEMGEFFSRDLATPITGSMDWSAEEAPFLLQPGQKPSTVRLNLVVTGPGTVWIDDISLLKAPK